MGKDSVFVLVPTYCKICDTPSSLPSQSQVSLSSLAESVMPDVSILRRTPVVLDAMLSGLPSEWLHATEGPETWSPYIVVGHLIEGERNDWIQRATLILAQGENLTFEPFDRFAQLQNDQTVPIEKLLAEFTELRQANLRTLMQWQLTEAQLDLPGIHPTLGPVTLRQLLATWVAHDLAHVAQIARVMAKRYRDDVGPWRANLSIMER